MTHTKFRGDGRDVSKMGIAGVVATTLSVILAIGLAAGCSPTRLTSTTPLTAPAVTADSATERGPVTVYLEPT